MPTATILHQLSPRDYLLGKRDGERRHEYRNGEVVAMSGGSRAHNLLTTRVARLLGNHLEGGPCRVYQSDMKVRIEAANRFYSQVMMVAHSGRFFKDWQGISTELVPSSLYRVA